MVVDFLDKETIPFMLIILNPAGGLQPMTTIPNYLKSKASYFIRRKPGKVEVNSFADMIMYGEFSYRPVNELAMWAEEVFIPLLTNSANHNGWPQVIAEDIAHHLQEFKNVVYQV